MEEKKEESTPRPINCWTDGACSGNPGPGAWAFILGICDINGELINDCGSVPLTTNNQMELRAIAEALWEVPEKSLVNIHTDSKNAIGWLFGWCTVLNRPDRMKRWKRKNPEIAAICAGIDACIEARQLKVGWVWVKGHANDPMNERVDAMAQGAIQR